MSYELRIICRIFYVASIVIFACTIFKPALAFDNENNVKFGGYVKTVASLTDFTGLDVEFAGSSKEDLPDYEGMSLTTLRLELLWHPDDSTTMEFAYAMAARIQDANGLDSFFAISAADPLSYRAIDLGERVCCAGENSDFQLLQNLDRAFITLSPSMGDIYVGRQPVAFGSARVINPTDIFSSFTYTELNMEERAGVDAVRVKIPVGAMGEMDIGMVFGDDFRPDESAAFLRARVYMFETDISPIVILFKQNLLAGLDITGSAGEAGYWLEGGYTFANIADDHMPEEDYVRISTGFDYSFSERIYAYIEYHFNDAGTSHTGDYEGLITGDSKETAYAEGAVYLFGRHYLAPGIAWQISPLLTFDGGALYNVNDGSVLLSPLFQYSLSDEASIDAGAFVGFGKGSRIQRNTDTGETAISAGSEFGLYADTFFISAKLYF